MVKKLSKTTILLLIIIAVLLAAVLTLSILLIGQKSQNVPQPIPEDKPPVSEQIPEEQTEPEATEEIVPEEPTGTLLDTKYITLVFPEDLQGQMEPSVEDTDTGTAVQFASEVSGKKLELFTILMTTDTAEGFLLGTLNHEEAGKIQVYMQMNEQNPDDWSAEDYQNIGTLQERVNDMIIQFHEDARFTPKR